MWTRLKSIFSNKTQSALQNLPLDFNRQVEQAIPLLANHDNQITDEKIVQLLIDNGIGASEAKEILLCLPTAFVRQWLTKVQWLDTYVEHTGKGKMIERKFSETQSYQIIWQVTTQYFTLNPQKDTILKIVGRSAEFHAINELLLNNPGYEPEDISLTQAIIIR